MGKKIDLCLVYRDMWQSSGKYMPRVDQLVRVAQPIIDMGCWRRVETNGGGFEQINLLYGENPNKSVRAWTQPFNNAGIQTQMLERGLNGIRMSPCPADVRKLMFKVKKKQGTDISRSFDGLNNPENLRLSFEFAKAGGMVAQGALSITHSPVHTVDYYVQLADQYIDLGAEEICIKDMAGVGRPVTIGKIVSGIRLRHPSILIQYHGHSTPGFSVASSLEAARAGADIIDVGMEPLSWGTGHADLLTIHAMLLDAGFSVPDVNFEAYMEVRQLTQNFMDDFLGYYMNPQNRFLNSFLIGPGLPGGMMGSLMSDLQNNLSSLNKYLTKNGKAPLNQDQLLLKLFDEVEYVWPQLGYPPLVTPFSQYVKNVALMNVIQMAKGRDRWTMIDENTWGMVLGQSGQLAAPLGDEIMAIAKKQGREFYSGVPQELYADKLPVFAKAMEEKGWKKGLDDEELLEYAMHPNEYERYKSGQAKEDFLTDLNKKKIAANTAVGASSQELSNAEGKKAVKQEPRKMNIDVDGQKFKVTVSYDTDVKTSSDHKHSGNISTSDAGPAEDNAKAPEVDKTSNGIYHEINAPLEGKFYLTKDSGEKGIKIGDILKSGDTVAYIESMKVLNAITADKGGKVVSILANQGEEVEEDSVLVKLDTNV